MIDLLRGDESKAWAPPRDNLSHWVLQARVRSGLDTAFGVSAAL